MDIDCIDDSESCFPFLTNVPGDAPDWIYSMRREMQEIVDGLYLGPYSVAVRSKVFAYTLIPLFNKFNQS